MSTLRSNPNTLAIVGAGLVGGAVLHELVLGWVRAHGGASPLGRHLMTPYDKLKSLAQAETFLKAGVTFQALDAIALKQSDDEAARQVNQARKELFQFLNASQNTAA